MKENKVKAYIGKQVLLVLNNNFKYTCTIPNFSGDSFRIIDKFGNKAEIRCDMISLIYEKGENNEI